MGQEIHHSMKIRHLALLSVPFMWKFVEVALVRLGLRDGIGFDDEYAPCRFFVDDLNAFLAGPGR